MTHTLKFYFLFSLSFVLLSTAQSQSTQGPTPVVIDDVKSNQYQIIFPLGWSEDGNFAYILQDVNPLVAAQIYSYHAVIQNITSNEILWEKEIEYNFEEESAPSYPIYLASTEKDETPYNNTFFQTGVWKEHGEEIQKKLQEYGIVRDQFTLNTDAYEDNMEFIEERSMKDEYIEDYELLLYQSDTYKTIYHYQCKDSIAYQNCPIYFEVKGYFRSPFQNIVAIVVYRLTYGFEEIFEYPFLLITDLDSGFEKEED